MSKDHYIIVQANSAEELQKKVNEERIWYSPQGGVSVTNYGTRDNTVYTQAMVLEED